MPSEPLPWCFRIRNKDGSERWYWKRRGFKSRALPKDPVERLREVRRLNAAADKDQCDVVAEGSIAWCVDRYRKSDAFKDRAENTREVYGRWLAYLEKGLGKHLAGDLDRMAVMRLKAKLSETYGRASVLHAFAVLRIVLEVARDHGLIAHNPASKPKLPIPAARRAVWTDAEIDAMLTKAPAAVALAVQLLLYTAQRPSDVVRMAWSQYDAAAGLITLRQIKTKALLAIPVHRELRSALDATRRRGPLIAVQRNGRAWSVAGLRVAAQVAMRGAAIDPKRLQVRDLRRSAVVRLAQAGATVPEIAAITGHSLATAEQIVAAYLPRTTETARGAVVKWERKGDEVQRVGPKAVK